MIPARGPQTRFVMYIWCKKVFMRLSSLDIWAWVCRLGGTRLSTGASREASVDNECLGKSMQVGGDGKSCSTRQV